MIKKKKCRTTISFKFIVTRFFFLLCIFCSQNFKVYDSTVKIASFVTHWPNDNLVKATVDTYGSEEVSSVNYFEIHNVFLTDAARADQIFDYKQYDQEETFFELTAIGMCGTKKRIYNAQNRRFTAMKSTRYLESGFNDYFGFKIEKIPNINFESVLIKIVDPFSKEIVFTIFLDSQNELTVSWNDKPTGSKQSKIFKRNHLSQEDFSFWFILKGSQLQVFHYGQQMSLLRIGWVPNLPKAISKLEGSSVYMTYSHIPENLQSSDNVLAQWARCKFSKFKKKCLKKFQETKL